MSSTRDHSQSRVSQEALLTPVCDTGHSEVLRGRLLGTQPFEKGLGFSHHQQGELHSWDHDRRKVGGRIRRTFWIFPEALGAIFLLTPCMGILPIYTLTFCFRREKKV